jgi:hypothetical protein
MYDDTIMIHGDVVRPLSWSEAVQIVSSVYSVLLNIELDVDVEVDVVERKGDGGERYCTTPESGPSGSSGSIS